MQTFLPLASYAASLAVLDYRRLGKQRVECKQLLRSMVKSGIIPLDYPGIKVRDLFPEYSTDAEIQEWILTSRGGWVNHPARKMWEKNPADLALYHDLCILEWECRGYNNSMPLIHNGEVEEDTGPKWLGNEAFHASHRSNLLRKDPEWYGQFGWEEPHDLPYIWPEA